MPIASDAAGDDSQLVSIIVPIYQAEEMLGACLDGFLAQTYTNWEAILVIDGSPDGSERVARRYAAKDSRFTVLVTPNGGPGAARNAGLAIARGSYITFVDSDDLLEPEALSVLVAALEGGEADMAGGIIYDFFPDSPRRVRYWTMRGPQFSRRWATYRLTDMPSLIEDSIVCAKLFRRSLIDRIGLEFPEHTHTEDIVPALQLELAARLTAIVPAEIYAHRRHGSAISANYLRPKTLGDWGTQATRTLRLIAAVPEQHVRDHYVLKHTLSQWWTRAERFTLIEDSGLLVVVERLAADMLDVAGREPDPLDTLRTSVLRAFAAGVPSRRWRELAAALRDDLDGRGQTPEVAISPLESPGPERAPAIARAALRAVDLLDRTDPLEDRLAAELLLSQVLSTAGRGWIDDATVVAAAIRGVEATAPDVLISIGLPGSPFGDDASPVADLAREHWRSLLPFTAGITAIRLEARGLVLRGSVHLDRPLEAEDVLRLSVVDRGSSRPRVVAVTVASPPQEPGPVSWQAVIPAEDLEALEKADLWLRRDSRHGRRVELPVVVSADHPSSLQVDLRSRPVSLFVALGGETRLTVGARVERTGRRAAAPAARTPRRVFTFPNWGSNPYMAMLQTEVRGSGASMPGTVEHPQLVRELEDRAATGVVHVHWTSPIIEKSTDPEDAEKRVEAVLRGLVAARERGRPIIWTVHNVLPHDTRFPLAAVRLHQGLADIADVVHVLGTTTQEAIGELYRLQPEKVRVLPHSSYAGIYGTRMERAAAREAIGSSSTTTQALFFGQMRPYKGLEHLFEAATQLQGTPAEVELLLAGNPTPDLRERIAELAQTDMRVTSALRFIEDSEVAAWFSAADVAVLPYERILNSGTMHLAATFGLPVLLPDEHTITADFGDEQWLRFFDPADAVSSIRASIEDGWFRDPAVRESALAYARRRSPYAMARAYAELIEEVSGRD
ncbi:glycosyltransferase [Agrococcus sp. KRD186]|uniref:glycosyltransferase n=1 Tax=Agrococcus sp. KRD186 TaxID=2729730 RepID=UPI0019D1C20F|nr:glycosyltransferase [Agrococcus sp. KRD186]